MRRTAFVVSLVTLFSLFAIYGNSQARPRRSTPTPTPTATSTPTPSSVVAFVSPVNGQTVSGSITVVFNITSSLVWWTQLAVDGAAVASGYNDLPWNTTTVANGTHQLTVYAFAEGATTPLGYSTISVNVNNSTSVSTATATPTATSTPKATASATNTPTPSPSASPTVVAITSPAQGATVSGTVTVVASVAPTVWWAKLYADASGVAVSPPYSFTWDSTKVPDGTHNLAVMAFPESSSTPLGVASIDVVVANNSANVGALHFGTLPPHAALPSDSTCAALIASTPETVSSNLTFNSAAAIPTSAELCSMQAAPVYSATFVPASDFALVDGDYSGSTDMIIRWAACKWGIDEDVLRAQAWGESGWLQDATGDWKTTLSDCENSVVTACATGGTWDAWTGTGCYQSYGIFQVKLHDFNAYPEAETSTALNADFHAAYERACMNGDINYLPGVTPSAGYPTYPNTTTDQMLWGCTGDWFSGSWYDPAALGYIGTIQGYLATRAWPQ